MTVTLIDRQMTGQEKWQKMAKLCPARIHDDIKFRVN